MKLKAHAMHRKKVDWIQSDIVPNGISVPKSFVPPKTITISASSDIVSTRVQKLFSFESLGLAILHIAPYLRAKISVNLFSVFVVPNPSVILSPKKLIFLPCNSIFKAPNCKHRSTERRFFGICGNFKRHFKGFLQIML